MNKYNMIAPCGINCSVCIGYLREKNRCPGCNLMGEDQSDYCKNCIIRNCTERKNNYCFTCNKYPCTRLKNLDKRYKTRYRTSLIQNLEDIKGIGIRKFINNEDNKWKCKKCNNTISIHRKECLNCKEPYLIDLNFEEKIVNSK